MNEQTAVFNLGIASPSANLRLSVTSPYVSRVASGGDESIRRLFGYLFGERHCKLGWFACKGNSDRSLSCIVSVLLRFYLYSQPRIH